VNRISVWPADSHNKIGKILLLTKTQDQLNDETQEKKAEKTRETLTESISGFASVFVVGSSLLLL